MDVSVDTIRAALKLLRDEKLVVTSQGIGSFIT
jgi:DNA-binding GntR family transcriptional regulator